MFADYIRTFTWDKKLETMVKKSGILGGQGKLPTIISPEEYRARFIAAMHRYFLPVPDRWSGLGRDVEIPNFSQVLYTKHVHNIFYAANTNVTSSVACRDR